MKLKPHSQWWCLWRLMVLVTQVEIIKPESSLTREAGPDAGLVFLLNLFFCLNREKWIMQYLCVLSSLLFVELPYASVFDVHFYCSSYLKKDSYIILGFLWFSNIFMLLADQFVYIFKFSHRVGWPLISCRVFWTTFAWVSFKKFK